MYVPVQSIYIPGMGEVNLAEYRVHLAMQTYDERLMFGRNKMTGDWCAFVKMPHGKDPVAVLSFGKEIPTPEAAVRRADEANTRKHSTDIMDAIERHNAQLDAEKERASDETAWQGAEILEHGSRKMGAHTSPRIFVPGKD